MLSRTDPTTARAQHAHPRRRRARIAVAQCDSHRHASTRKHAASKMCSANRRGCALSEQTKRQSTASTPASDGLQTAATSSRPESHVHSERKHSRCDATRSNRAHQMDNAAHQHAHRAMAACIVAYCFGRRGETRLHRDVATAAPHTDTAFASHALQGGDGAGVSSLKAMPCRRKPAQCSHSGGGDAGTVVHRVRAPPPRPRKRANTHCTIALAANPRSQHLQSSGVRDKPCPNDQLQRSWLVCQSLARASKGTDREEQATPTRALRPSHTVPPCTARSRAVSGARAPRRLARET